MGCAAADPYGISSLTTHLLKLERELLVSAVEDSLVLILGLSNHVSHPTVAQDI